MDDDKMFPDLLPSDKVPIRIRKTKHTAKKLTENIRILEDRKGADKMYPRELFVREITAQSQRLEKEKENG